MLKHSANLLMLECVFDRRSEERISFFNPDMLTFFIFQYCMVFLIIMVALAIRFCLRSKSDQKYRNQVSGCLECNVMPILVITRSNV